MHHCHGFRESILNYHSPPPNPAATSHVSPTEESSQCVMCKRSLRELRLEQRFDFFSEKMGLGSLELESQRTCLWIRPQWPDTAWVKHVIKFKQSNHMALTMLRYLNLISIHIIFPFFLWSVLFSTEKSNTFPTSAKFVWKCGLFNVFSCDF